MKFKTITAILLGATALAAAPVLPVTRGIWQDTAVTAEAATTNSWYYYSAGSYQSSVVTYRLDTANKQAYIYSSYGTSGTLQIPATINYASYNYPIVGIDSYAFQSYSNLLTLDLTAASNLRQLSGYTFTGSTIRTVKLGGANLTIRENAFRDASKLQTVEFTNDSKTLTVEKDAFAGSGLRYFNFYGKTLTAMPYSFARTNSLNYFYIDSKTDTVTIQTKAFAWSSIKFLDVYCRSITIGSNAFSDPDESFSSSQLTWVDFNNSVKVVKLEDSAFSGLWLLQTVSFYNSSVSLTMGERTFAGSSVKTVNLPNSATVIPKSCFEYCQLTSSPIASGIKTIETNAFLYASLPETINIPASVTTISETAFTYITGVKQFKVASGNTSFKISGGGLYTSDLSRLVCYPPNNASKNYVVIPAKTIPAGTIANNPNIQSLNIQNYVRRSGDQSNFPNLTSLRSVILPSAEFKKTGEQILTSFSCFAATINEVNGYRIVQQPQGKEPCFYSKFASYITAHFDEFDDNYFMTEYIDTMATYVVNQVTTTSMSDLQKAVRLHQWICNRTTYDPRVIADEDFCDIKNHKDASVFLHQETISGKKQYVTVCEGYAKCYKILMNKAKVTTHYVVGEYYDNKGKRHGHCWNLVRLNNIWYHVDVTWDDEQNDERNSDFKKANRYKYFLCPDAVFNTDNHSRYTWESKDDTNLKKGTDVATDYNYYRLGDVNNDFAYNTNDTTLFNQFANGTTPNAMQKVRGDLNFDGKVNSTDRNLFNNYINTYKNTYSRPALWRFTMLEK